MKLFLLAVMLLCPLLATAQLAVTVSLPKVIGQKAMIEMKLKNGLSEKVEAARAVCFLLDGQGKMVGQAGRWVIGGTKTRPALEPKKETTFNFVITGREPFATTNLTVRLSFTRLVLDGGRLADAAKDVEIKSK